MIDYKALRKERVSLIKQLEDKRGAGLLTYITSNRENLTTQIADDAVRLFYNHLEVLGKKDNIALFLYSYGGHINAPMRLVHLVREYCEKFSVLVPFKAHSAATLLCLGADSIVMGKMAELSPVDPTTTNPFNPPDAADQTHRKRLPISVEDVTSYFGLAKDKAGLEKEEMMIEVYKILADKINPLALGNVYRVQNVIRRIIRQLLNLHMDLEKEKKSIDNIILYLTEKLYTHDYQITRDVAKNELKLKIEEPNDDIEKIMWALFDNYERTLQLRDPYNPLILLGEKEIVKYSFPGAFVESAMQSDVFMFEGEIIKTKAQPGMPVGIPGISVKRTFQGWREFKEK